MIKKKGIALEICPISNEVLHLTPTIGGHSLPIILANNVPCSLNSDNGTFFRSTLSHDFYQVMIANHSMNLLGWKTLAMWSLEYSCLGEEKERVLKSWETQWALFVKWIVDKYWGLFLNLETSMILTWGKVKFVLKVDENNISLLIDHTSFCHTKCYTATKHFSRMLNTKWTVFKTPSPVLSFVSTEVSVQFAMSRQVVSCWKSSSNIKLYGKSIHCHGEWLHTSYLFMSCHHVIFNAFFPSKPWCSASFQFHSTLPTSQREVASLSI